MTQLIGYVRTLENKDHRARGEQVLAALRTLGIEPTIQECRWLKVRNIAVDFSPDPKLVFSAHYDADKYSPGANDNGSGVAVLLGLCHELRHSEAPIRVIFFDREELRTPVVRLGCLGSFYYTLTNNLRSICAVFNLEFCGLGDFLGIWPIKGSQSNLPAVQGVKRAATRLGLQFIIVNIPWLFINSDHLPFRLKGISNAFTLSLFPASQIPAMESLLENFSILRFLFGQRPTLPWPLSVIHTAQDTSAILNEDSLRLMLSLLLELIQREEGKMVSEISNFALTGYFNPATPPSVTGSWYDRCRGA